MNSAPPEGVAGGGRGGPGHPLPSDAPTAKPLEKHLVLTRRSSTPHPATERQGVDVHPLGSTPSVPSLDTVDIGWRGDPADIVDAASTDPYELVRQMIPAPPEWHARAACRYERTNLFFLAQGPAVRAAKRICGTCRVSAQCLADALATPERADYGTRGATTANERKRMRRDAHHVHPSTGGPTP